MEVGRINKTTFTGFTMPKKVVIGYNAQPLTKQNFLNNPAIRECANKYEVLLKCKKNVITVPCDKFKTAVWAFVSSIIGGGAGLISAAGAGAQASSLPVLAGLTIPPALCVLGARLLNNRPSYQYSIQAGKKISADRFGKLALGGTLSKEFIINNEGDIKNVHSLCKDIEKKDYDKFLDIIDNYNSDDVISILKDKKIKEEFSDGEHFNYAYTNCGGSFITNVLFRKLQDKNLLPKDAYDRLIAEREERYNNWR